MSKADDVFLKQFGVVLGLLVIFSILTFFLVRGIAANASKEVLASERLTLERIRPVGQVAVAAAQPEAQPAATAPAETPAEAAPAKEAPPAQEEAVAAAASAQTAAATEGRSGEEVYQSLCIACHLTGAAKAPKTGDKEAWAPRAEQGLEALVGSVIQGKGAMPPKAGNPNLTEQEIERAVQYLLEKADLSAG